MAYPEKAIHPGEMKLVVPHNDKCHPVVGRTYTEQCRDQLGTVIGLITGGKKSLPKLPCKEFPGPVFWNELRQVPDNDTELNHSISAEESGESIREAHQDEELPNETVLPSLTTLFEQVLAVVPIGHEVIACLWSMDTPAVGRLASASKACLDAVAIYVSRFHLPLGDYQDCDWLPSALDGIDDARRSTIGIGCNLFIRGRDPSVAPGDIKGIPKAWLSHKTRNTLWNIAQDNKADADTYEKFFPFLVNDKRLLDAEAKLGARLQEQGLFYMEAANHYLQEVSYNIPMLRSLNQYGGALKNIRLHEVPMMDTRIVEMILVTCPQLEILGAINCELLHVGHLIPLLDLVYWNSKRMVKKPVVLQFYPRTYFGPLNNRLGTHIVSWDPINVNVLTSFFTTVFLAVMKAIPMGIELLSERQDFRRFFDLVPMKPGQGAAFLHHIFTWIDSAMSTPSYFLLPDIVKEGLEDQVLMSLLQGRDQKMKYRQRNEQFKQHTCNRCSNTLIRTFFRLEMEIRRPEHWVCRMCDLQYALNGEAHHRLIEKRELLNTFLSSSDESVQSPGQVMDRDLQDTVAPLLVNPFARSPALHSVARAEAVRNHQNLPRVLDLIAPERDYAILGASGEAALLDVHNKLQELRGIYMDHPTLTKQTIPTWARLNGKRIRNQSWEYILWKDAVKDSAEHQASRFW
ncbi:hypothetical protein CGRA01v4_02389 [Colletotrichum graminicola]|uniref:Uncharacterized protein n=1 Tax=Colletotrichum graminicola (strain M1.001 / M2 / FGSC 10212) TaxID=645133 RepID=E3Q3I2_COLGM|nr:uncharacterized protein GLRG_00728 [Colletotrichum graminicola M1.001]EFQ25584.1 hypothetical protein GLRG_00728 [Colletotrichum graminicola M1.001]WDK11110.1 hypothetical protein CGRA01v4_02389 [Colletotrichum graminicola]